jgi:hypothetical protein
MSEPVLSDPVELYVVFKPRKLRDGVAECSLYTDEKTALARCEEVNNSILPSACVVMPISVIAQGELRDEYKWWDVFHIGCRMTRYKIKLIVPESVWR